MLGDIIQEPPPKTQHIGQGAGSSLAALHGPQTPSKPALPQITSDVNIEEPPLMALTSDLPEYGGFPGPQPTDKQALANRPQHPAPPVAGSTTPGRGRLEVVLNVSPHKTLPGNTSLWTEADLSDHEQDQPFPTSASQSSSRKRKAAHTTTASSSSSRLNVNNNSTNPATTPAAQGTAKRARGRPKGWRPGMPSTKTGLPTASAFRYTDKDGNRIASSAPSSSAAGPKSSSNNNTTTTGPKRRGRPPRAPSPTPRQVWERLEPPQYVPFMCEWKGCKAELQNMETLRRHVRKIHGWRVKHGLQCRWGECDLQQQQQQQQQQEEEEEEGKDGQTVFTTAEAFHEHMEEQHLVPFVWHVGDGVQNQKLVLTSRLSKEEQDEDEKAPAYLLGPDGEQVTPWVKGQQVEDYLTWRENRNRLKQILLQRDENAPFEEEEEEQQQAEGGDKVGATVSSST